MDPSGSQITDCHQAQNQDYSNTSLLILATFVSAKLPGGVVGRFQYAYWTTDSLGLISCQGAVSSDL